MPADSCDEVEIKDLFAYLAKQGMGEFLELMQSAKYTKGGRLNKSGTCRNTGLRLKELVRCLALCREILKDKTS